MNGLRNKSNGLIEPIVMYQGKVLDGRNRAEACERLGIEPKTVEFDGDDLLEFVLSKNLHRRHLTTSQRGMVAAKIANLPHGGHNKKQDANLHLASSQVSREQVAKDLKVSQRSVATAKEVLQEGTPEVVQQVEKGSMSLNAAAATLASKQDANLHLASNKPRKKSKPAIPEKEEVADSEVSEGDTSPPVAPESATTATVADDTPVDPYDLQFADFKERGVHIDGLIECLRKMKELHRLHGQPVAAHYKTWELMTGKLNAYIAECTEFCGMLYPPSTSGTNNPQP